MPWLCHTWKGQLMLLYCKPQFKQRWPSWEWRKLHLPMWLSNIWLDNLLDKGVTFIWRKRVECPLWAQNEVLSRVEEFKYLGVCSQVKGEWSRRLTDRLVQSWQWCGCYTSLLWWKESWENQSIWRLMWPYRPIWSGALCSDWKNKITDASICDEFPMKGVCVQP